MDLIHNALAHAAELESGPPPHHSHSESEAESFRLESSPAGLAETGTGLLPNDKE
jgi:hypothetical protein